MSDFSSNADAFARELERIASNLEDGIERGLDKGAAILKAGKDDEKEVTYARPLAPGQKERTGAFRDGDKIEKGPLERRVVMIGPAAEYESHLARLPTGKDGVNRSNPAADNAVKKHTDKAVQAVADEINRALK